MRAGRRESPKLVHQIPCSPRISSFSGFKITRCVLLHWQKTRCPLPQLAQKCPFAQNKKRQPSGDAEESQTKPNPTQKGWGGGNSYSSDYKKAKRNCKLSFRGHPLPQFLFLSCVKGIVVCYKWNSKCPSSTSSISGRPQDLTVPS